MSRRAALLAVALAAGCADGKSALTVHVTSDGAIGGIDHFAVTVAELTTPPAMVGPLTVAAPGGSIPPDQTFTLVFDSNVHATVDVSVSAVDASGATLSKGDAMIAVSPSQHEDVTVTLPSTGGGDMGAGGGGGSGGGDLAGVPDLLPEPGCPPNGDGGVAAVGDPCTGTISQVCYSGAAGSCGVGNCRPGVQYCLDGAWGPCVGEVNPMPEVCDGRDEDCNGTADDGLPSVTCGVGATAVTVQSCTSGKPTVCTPKPANAETCDGIDNDGNGAIDEIGSDGKACPYCIHVAPSGNDGNDGSAATPMRTITAAITKAAGLTSGPKIVCAAAAANTCLTTPASFNYGEAITMVDGVHVYGGYESTNWTRNLVNCFTQLVKTDANPVVGFDQTIVHTTILDGFEVAGHPSVAIKGSQGAVVSNCDLETSCSVGGNDVNCANIIVLNYFATPATPLITRNRFNAGYYAIHSTKSAPVILGNCESRDATGHCITSCNFPNTNLFTKGFTGGANNTVLLDYSPGSVFAENQICTTGTSLGITGDATNTLIRGNSIQPPNANAYAIYAYSCNGSPWIVDNTQLSGGSAGFNQPSGSILAKDGCHLRIDHNPLINGPSGGNSGDVSAIWCQRDAVSLRESRCEIVDNTITNTRTNSTATAAAVRCDDASCPLIFGNHITGGGGGTNTYALLLGRSGSLVARNIIDIGCMGGTTGVSAGIDLTDSFARIENNLVRGGACAGNVYGVREHIINSGDEVDLHSNTISGGGMASGCSGHALDFEVGATSPASARGLVRNNILLPGPCSTAAWDVYEGAAVSPRVLLNNDLAPVPTLYHSNAGGDLTTIAAVNALTGAAANFSADPMLAVDGIHLNAGSMCIDSGTPQGAPAEDYDGMSRPNGAGFDVGMDEK